MYSGTVLPDIRYVVNIGLPMRPVCMTKRPKKTKKETLLWQTEYLSRPPLVVGSKSNFAWGEGSSVFQVSSKSVKLKWFPRYWIEIYFFVALAILTYTVDCIYRPLAQFQQETYICSSYDQKLECLVFSDTVYRHKQKTSEKYYCR